MPPLQINPAQIALLRQIDKTLFIYLAGGAVIEVVGSNQYIETLATDLARGMVRISGETGPALLWDLSTVPKPAT